MPGIFEQSFNTPLPNTDIAGQLMALRMRNEAIKPDGIIKGLSQVGKVFTDAAEEQRAANTALLQRKLDMLNPAQVEQMIAQGIDPVAEAYNADIPINVDDEALNKAWRANIIDAQTAQGNKWVTTVLPTIPHEDKLKLLKGDASIYQKYGLSDFMRMSPELRTFIHDSIRDAATFENEKAYYEGRKSAYSYLQDGSTPGEEYFKKPSIYPEGQLPTSKLDSDETAVKELSKEINTTAAKQGSMPAPEIGEKLALHPLGTLPTTEDNTARATQVVQDLIGLYGRYSREHPNSNIEDFIQEIGESDYFPSRNIDSNEARAILSQFRIWPAGEKAATEMAALVRSNTSVDTPLTLNTAEDMENAIRLQKQYQDSGNSTAALDTAQKIKKQAEQNIINKHHKELLTALREGANKQQINAIRDKANRTLLTRKDSMSPERLAVYQQAIKTVFDSYENQAGDSNRTKEENRQSFINNNRNQLRADSQFVGQDALRAGNQIKVPKEIAELDEKTKTAIKNTFLKNDALRVAWNDADDTTKDILIWQTLKQIGALSDYNKITDPKQLNELLTSSKYKTGINDSKFISRCRAIVNSDLLNSFRNQHTQKELENTVATNATNGVNR